MVMRVGIWNIEKYLKTGEGADSYLHLPEYIYNKFESLDSNKYPFLSNLSLYEYDVFDKSQLKLLYFEVDNFIKENTEDIHVKHYGEKIILAIQEAEKSHLAIIFTPF